LLDAWSKFVGIDIVAQALSHLPAEARRSPSRVSA
jgi:hypothetical protein